MSYWRKAAIAATCAASMFAMDQVQAADWLMLQGTEPADASARAKVWGFIQAQYQKDYSKPCEYAPCTGQYIPPMLIGPDLTSQSAFNVNRARIGVRGTGMPLDNRVNYFFLAEFGNNGITHPGNAFAKVTDASITLSYIKGARIRAGLFKTPGSEESFQGIATFQYNNFTEVTNQMLLERFPNHDGADNQNLFKPAQGGVLGANQNGFKDSVGAVRDVGVEVFDSFLIGGWDHSYAVMIGNGNGLNLSDNNSNKDVYAYWSSEKVYGGKGPFRQGWKFFGWYQTGKRQLDRTNDNIYNPETHTRTRYGIGTEYLKKPWRVTAEYMRGRGMIFVGPDKPSFDQNGTAAPGGDGADGRAEGWYIEGGWFIPRTSWELDLRYDYYNRLKGDKLESHWKTVTLGAQYHLNKKTRVTLNYAIRRVNSPNFSGPGPGGNPNNLMDQIGNRISLQLTHIF